MPHAVVPIRHARGVPGVPLGVFANLRRLTASGKLADNTLLVCWRYEMPVVRFHVSPFRSIGGISHTSVKVRACGHIGAGEHLPG
jgi:hypothetical protein